MKRAVRILRIVMPAVAVICTVVFVPWTGVWAWLAPLPETVQEQVDDAIDYGLDGIVVYVDQSDKTPALYSAGWGVQTALGQGRRAEAAVRRAGGGGEN